MDLTLQKLGFDLDFERACEERRNHDPLILPARVVGQHRREWDVASSAGLTRAVLAGKRWAGGEVDEEIQPTVGDWVLLRVARAEHAQQFDPNFPPTIVQLLPRRTELTRAQALQRAKKQVIVANVDVLFVVASFPEPDGRASALERTVNPRRLERYLAAVRSGGARPVVILNKSDLCEDAERLASELRERLGETPVLVLSCKADPELQALTPYLKAGQTVGLVGMSGVGKSSLLNRLLAEEKAKIGETRGVDARGRHTTTHRELFTTSQGVLIIDTPGMREFALVEDEELGLSSFTDITLFAESCRFTDCRHESEPACAVRAAVQGGQLTLDRLEHYKKLREEVSGTPGSKRGRKPGREKGRN